LLFIIGTELAAGTFALGFGGIPIAFLIVASSGIPGVGVNPGLRPFFICSALGMPGVDLPVIGTTVPLAGMPGIGAPFTGSGLDDSPGGMFAGSSFIMAFAFVLEFELETADDPQADKSAAAASKIAVVLNIKKKPLETLK
jgi:hypothetical protein